LKLLEKKQNLFTINLFCKVLNILRRDYSLQLSMIRYSLLIFVINDL